MCPQIFSYLSSSWRKFESNLANFNAFFEWFLAIFSPITWNIVMKLGQKWDKMDTKKIQKTRSQNFEPCWRCIGSELQKIAQIGQNFMDDPKIFRKKFFGSKVSKWSNSKSYYAKSEIWRPSKIFPFTRSLARHLEIFRKFFFGSKVFRSGHSS